MGRQFVSRPHVLVITAVFLGLLSLGLSMGQWLSAPMAILGAAMLFWSYRRNTIRT